MGGLYSHTTRATGTVLTAAIYNGDHQNHIDNMLPSMLDDQSTNVAAMQATTSPGGVGTESLATNLQGEIERLRHVIKTIHGGAQWYPGSAAPALATANTWTAAQTLQSTDAGASAISLLILDRFSASPANADSLIAIAFRGRDDGANSIDWAKEFATIVNVSAAAKASKIEWQTYVSNSLATRWVMGAGFFGASLSDPGAEIVNALGFQQSGMALKPHIQDVIDADSAVATGTTVMPDDDTIPQNTEGDEYLSVSITPKHANNILVIEALLHVSVSAGNHMTAGLFQDSTAGALKGAMTYNGDNGRIRTLHLLHRMTAGTTSATTFKVRAGPSAAATMTFNGETGARLLGGVMVSYLHVREFAP